MRNQKGVRGDPSVAGRCRSYQREKTKIQKGRDSLLLANGGLEQTLAGQVQLVFGVQEPLVEPLETAAHLIQLHLREQQFRLRLLELGR